MIYVQNNDKSLLIQGASLFHKNVKNVKSLLKQKTGLFQTVRYTWNLILSALVYNGTPLQYSCLENPMDEGPWQAVVHGVAKSRTGLSDFTFTFHFHAPEKEMATRSSVLAWRILGMGEPGGLPSVGSHRVGHD